MNVRKKLSGLTLGLVICVIVVHALFFLMEAVLWMQPQVHDPLIYLLNNPVALPFPVQALTLRNLFVNQGFYNLFLAIAGIGGIHLVRKGDQNAGFALILFLCFAAVGAGTTLAFSTRAYLLAVFQAVPAAIAFLRVVAVYKNAAASSSL